MFLHKPSTDICENVECPDSKVCEADFDTGEAVCVCPYCSLEDFENDNNLYCGMWSQVFIKK